MVDNKLQNKVVLVTGAARRIGAEIARFLHSQDFNIIIHYNKSKSEARSLAKELNSLRENSAHLIAADLAQLVDLSFVANFADQILSFYGKLDVLVNNASSFFPTPIGEVNLEQWRDLMISNTGGPFFLAQCLVPYLKQTRGNIINISDIHSIKPLKNYSVYSIAKAASNMVTMSLAKELAPDIRVNTVAPGPILPPEGINSFSQQQKEEIINKTLLKKPGSPLDIARAVYFFITNEYITGQILAVDGGRSIK